MIRLGARPTRARTTTTDTSDATAAVMALLRGHVPLTLLLDLADPLGPDSRDILLAELVAEDVRRDRAALADAATDFSADQDVC